MNIKLSEFKYAKVLVVGDIMLDRYWYGSASRISLEAPVPIVNIDTVEERPGGAANVAMNVAALGGYSHLVGLTGIDDAANILSKLLTNMHVKYDFISVPNHPTITKLRVLSHNHQLIRLDFEKNFKSISPELIYKYINCAIDNDVEVIVLSDYAKGTLTNAQQIIRLARKANVPVLVDPKGKDFARYQGATVLTPNLSEIEAVSGKCKTEADLVKISMKIIADFELSALLVTRSEHGMTLLQAGKAPMHIPAQAKKVYDVTGAGDTVIGVLAVMLASGNSLEESCYIANVAAGLVVGKLGTSTISPLELENALYNRTGVDLGVMTEEQLKRAVAAARQRGEKVVMTNGIFDILHAGHIAYLENARRLGDRLIIAVNSDASTKRLKGNSRPVNPLKQRMIMLSALEAVDWVVSFDDDTPQRLIASILPDYLVKGGDYKLKQIAGSEEVLAHGGEVVVLNFENGYSTTNIIEKFDKAYTKCKY